MKRLFSFILDLLFPPKCVFCSRIVHKTDGGWCDKCIESLPYADNYGKQEGEFFDFCVSPLYYTDIIRRSILRYKFSGTSFYADTYGNLLAEWIQSCHDIEFDVISWVPLSDNHKRKRGYDQAKLLALSSAVNLNKNATETLTKTRNTRAQSELGDKTERSANVLGAYVASAPDVIHGKRILLIDDVVTTCSTLNECAKTLMEAGAKSVVCATLARGE